MMGDKMVKNSSIGSTRKRLSDITNLQSEIRSPGKKKQISLPFNDSHTNDYIQQLLKENAAVMKLVQERDKVIELTGVEMQKLRVVVQKTQLQNWHLAQSNSHMLAELNVGKDRLKALQHALACREALLKTKIAELKDEANMEHRRNGLQENAKIQHKPSNLQEKEITPKKEAVDQLQDKNNDESKMTTNRKGCPSRSQSMGSITSQQAADKEMAENKRRCLRRQSVRLKQNQEPPGDFLEIDVVNTPISHQLLKKPSSDTAEKEEGLQDSSNASQPSRSSIGRSSRRAAGKVSSYKEPSLTVKMRRPV